MRHLLVLAVTFALWVGCQRDGETVAPPDGPAVGSGGGVAQGGEGGGGGAGGQEGGGQPQGGEAPLRLGLVANTASANPGPEERALAELTALAAGVRAVVVDVPWRDLDAEAAGTIASRVDDYAARDLAIVLNLQIVDGRADLRPEPLTAEAWDAAATVAALDGALTSLLSASGGQLAAVVLGRRVDAYLSEHPEDEQALAELLSAGVDQLAAASVPHGVGLAYVGEDPSEGYLTLAGLGDVTALAYLPGLGLSTLTADVSHAKALDDMIDLAGGRPIHLYAAGYPSAETIGSSTDTQAQQLDAFFDALQSRRGAFPLVVVQQLHDLDAPSCEALALAQNVAVDDPLGAHLCSTGLRDVAGSPKPAFARFLQASAHFAQP